MIFRIQNTYLKRKNALYKKREKAFKNRAQRPPVHLRAFPTVLHIQNSKQWGYRAVSNKLAQKTQSGDKGMANA